MSRSLPPDDPPRIVKPSGTGYKHLPLLALTSDELLTEDGLVLPADQLPHILITHPPSILVCQGFGPHLERLLRVFGSNSGFQFRATPKEKEPFGDRSGRFTVVDTVINFVGFQGLCQEKTYGRRWTKYHYPLDPIHFTRDGIDDLYPEDTPRLSKLLRFGTEVRAFCERYELPIKASAGGLAARLLRDKRFYPEPRRKCPAIINRTARSRLPGNYYRLPARPNVSYPEVHYLDMSAAHHSVATWTRFPDANSLHAYGYWTENHQGVYKREPSGYGLHHLRIMVPPKKWNHCLPPWMEGPPGARSAWIYSNELALAESLGVRILGVHCSLVSHQAENGLNQYAKWAKEVVRESAAYRPWLKPTLLATYGVLATRPRTFETGYYRAKGGERTSYHLGALSFPVYAHSAGVEVDSKVANVIHRGMIEAAVRTEAIRMAQTLSYDGHDVLAVYADGIFVVPSWRGLRFLEPPWAVKDVCTELWFKDETHLACDQFKRWPGGVPPVAEKDRKNHLQRRGILIQSRT